MRTERRPLRVNATLSRQVSLTEPPFHDQLMKCCGTVAAAAAKIRLVVDPIACDGIGIGNHLAPGVVELDRWGYPLIAEGPLSARQERAAARAVRGCPRRALAIALCGDP